LPLLARREKGQTSEELPVISIERVVCPVDFSSVSRAALDHAVALARRCRARLTAVHVVPSRPRSADPARTLDILTGPARRAGVDVDAVVVVGEVVRGIFERTRPGRGDLLVVGTNGSEGVERLLMGSVAHRIVGEAACPVLTVPPGAAHPVLPRNGGFFDRVVCAVDFSAASLRALEYGCVLAEEGNDVSVLHVVEPPASALLLPGRPWAHASDPDTILAAQGRFEALLPAYQPGDPAPRLELRVGRIGEEILRFAREREAQVVVMGAQGRGRGLLGRLSPGSVTARVVRRAACPVLSVRDATPPPSGR
jgi:nucleotide-binding universal stress UspA family protein